MVVVVMDGGGSVWGESGGVQQNTYEPKENVVAKTTQKGRFLCGVASKRTNGTKSSVISFVCFNGEWRKTFKLIEELIEKLNGKILKTN